MSIVSGYPKRRRGGRTGDADDKLVRNYEEVWMVLTTVATDDPFVILNTPGIPQRYQPYQSDGQARCINAACQLAGDDDGTGTLWDVTCRYSTKYDVSQQPENPVNRPPRFSLSLAHFQTPAVRDNGLVNGQRIAVLNLAGDAYSPPPEIDDSRLTLVARRNEATLPFVAMQLYKDAVNSDTWNNCEPRTVKLFNVSCGEMQIENGYQYYEVQYEFQYNPDTWDLRLLEYGYNGLVCNGSGTPKKTAFGGDQPKLLKKRNATPGANVVLVTSESDPQKANFTTWRVYKEMPFASLNLAIPAGQ